MTRLGGLEVLAFTGGILGALVRQGASFFVHADGDTRSAD
jgi:predicted membrane protein